MLTALYFGALIHILEIMNSLIFSSLEQRTLKIDLTVTFNELFLYSILLSTPKGQT